MTKQLSLLGPGHREVVPADPNLTPSEARRLKPSCRKVLARLRSRPANNVELADLCGPRYGGRLWDLRRAGCVIESKLIGEGLWKYTLKHEPAGLA